MKLRICVIALFIAGHFAVAETAQPIIEILSAIDQVNNGVKLDCLGKASDDKSLVSVLSSKCMERDKFFHGIADKTMTVQDAAQWLSDNGSIAQYSITQ